MKFLIVRQEQRGEVGAGIKEIKAAAPKENKSIGCWTLSAHGKTEEGEILGEDGLWQSEEKWL